VKHHSSKILKKEQHQRSMRSHNRAEQDFTAVTTTVCEQVLNVKTRVHWERRGNHSSKLASRGTF